MRPLIAFAFVLGLASSALAQDQAPTTPTVASLAWLAGEWLGVGREGDGPPQGAARLHWTPPTDGVVTYLFTWNTPHDGHVHHALSIFRDGESGVVGQGIHYGRDFRTFERAPWRLRLASAGAQAVTFECVEHCRAHRISFTMIGDMLEERWTQADGSRPDWIVRYRRSAG